VLSNQSNKSVNLNYSVVRVIKYIDGAYCVGSVVSGTKRTIRSCGVCCYICTWLVHPPTYLVTPDVCTTRLPHNLFVRVLQSPLNGDASYRTLMHQGFLRARNFRIRITSCRFSYFCTVFHVLTLCLAFLEQTIGNSDLRDRVTVTPHIACNSDSSIAFVRTVSSPRHTASKRKC